MSALTPEQRAEVAVMINHAIAYVASGLYSYSAESSVVSGASQGSGSAVEAPACPQDTVAPAPAIPQCVLPNHPHDGLHEPSRGVAVPLGDEGNGQREILDRLGEVGSLNGAGGGPGLVRDVGGLLGQERGVDVGCGCECHESSPSLVSTVSPSVGDGASAGGVESTPPPTSTQIDPDAIAEAIRAGFPKHVELVVGGRSVRAVVSDAFGARP